MPGPISFPDPNNPKPVNYGGTISSPQIFEGTAGIYDVSGDPAGAGTKVGELHATAAFTLESSSHVAEVLELTDLSAYAAASHLRYDYLNAPPALHAKHLAMVKASNTSGGKRWGLSVTRHIQGTKSSIAGQLVDYSLSSQGSYTYDIWDLYCGSSRSTAVMGGIVGRLFRAKKSGEPEVIDQWVLSPAFTAPDGTVKMWADKLNNGGFNLDFWATGTTEQGTYHHFGWVLTPYT